MSPFTGLVCLAIVIKFQQEMPDLCIILYHDSREWPYNWQRGETSPRDSFWHKKSMNGGEGERGDHFHHFRALAELIKQNIKSVHCTSERGREGGAGLVRSFVSAFMLPLPKLYVGSFSGGCCWQRRRTRTRWRPRPRRRWRALSGRDIYIGWLVATAGAAVTQPSFD